MTCLFRMFCVVGALLVGRAVFGAEPITCKAPTVSTAVSPQLIETMPGSDGKLLFSEPKGVYGSIGADGAVTRRTLTCGPGCVDGSQAANIVGIVPIDSNRAYVNWFHSTAGNPNNNQIASYVSEVDVAAGTRVDHALPVNNAFATGRAGGALHSSGRFFFGANWTPGLWEFNGSQFQSFTTGNTITIADVKIGGDGKVYAGQYGVEPVSRMHPDTKVVEKFPNSDSFPEYAISLAAGSDGSVWAAEANRGRLLRFTPEGIRADYTPAAAPVTIKSAPDGRLFFSTIDKRIGYFEPRKQPIEINYFESGVQQGGSLAFRLKLDGNYDLFIGGRNPSTNKDAISQCSVKYEAPPVKAPQLSVTIERLPQVIENVLGGLYFDYTVIVKNVGDAPTSGEITLGFVLDAPAGAPRETYASAPGPFTCQFLNCTTSAVLQPRDIAVIVWSHTAYFVRGSHKASAIVSGGGSPSATSNVDVITVDGRLMNDIILPGPKKVSGRKR